jgi:lipopolysaccharide biosynthesis glycosyltransferase
LTPLRIFIGFDEKQPIAYHVCSESLIRTSSLPLAITPLCQSQLPRMTCGHIEDYPASNTFNLTRFLVPILAGYQGLALYLDGDMVVKHDIAELFDSFQYGHALAVVKHDYQSRARAKFRGQVNQDYPRKNWSSVVLWYCGHFAHKQMTREHLGNSSAEYLHRFGWLQDTQIQALDPSWNVLADEPKQAKDPKIVHYTLGTPCFPEYEQCQYAGLWHQARANLNHPL